MNTVKFYEWRNFSIHTIDLVRWDIDLHINPIVQIFFTIFDYF